MNGREKTQLQVERGTRAIVQGVDDLRLTFGFDKVVVLTPIVETRLRSGLLAAREMKVAIQSPFGDLLVTIPYGFPKVACSVEIDLSSTVEDAERAKNLLADLKAIASASREDGNHIVPSEVVTNAIRKLTEEIGESSTAAVSERDVIVEDDQDIGDAPVTFFCCRRCRSCLFDSTEFHEHHGVLGANANNVKCTSLFLENPPRFLTLDGTSQEGKVLCVKCGTRVGAWSWVGSKCSCGEWIVPAYQFTKSKLDERKE